MTRNNFIARLKGSGDAPAAEQRDPKLRDLLGGLRRSAEREEQRRERDAEEPPKNLPFRGRFSRRQIN